MAYRVKPVKRNKGPQFKVQYERIENGVRKTSDLPKERWANYGFSTDMTIEQAQAVKESLNAEEHLKRHQDRRSKIEERLKKEDLIECAFLPPSLVKEFEDKLFRRRANNGKLPSYWTRTKSVIRAIALTPTEWGDNKERFYDHFSSQGLSISYVHRIIGLLNKYGAFYCRKRKEFFEEVAQPTGVERGRIADKNFETPGKGNKKSDPITPEMLTAVHSKISLEHYNWLYLTVWFGLRPEEVDILHNVKNYRIKKAGETPVLEVYQPKLVTLERDKRWKAIPCFLPEMEEGVKIIQAGKFKRPLSKSVASWFNDPRIGLYGGRKGFRSLMKKKGQILEDVSAWLGHTSVDRTFADYVDKLEVSFKKVS